MVAAAAFAGGAAWAVQDCDIGGEPVNPANGHTTQGKTGLMRCRDRDTGQVVREQELQNGKFMGVVRYFTDGKLSREQTVNERGNMQGRAREFAPGGQVLREATYDNGTQTGLSRSFHPNGQLHRATFYGPQGEQAYAEFTARGELRGLRCGDKPLLAPAVDDAKLCGFPSRLSQVQFVAENGSLRARATYQAGKRVRYETYQDNGTPAQQEEVSATARIERSFGPEGNKRREMQWALNGTQAVREREQEFAASGAITRERRWANGELSSEQTFYLNGQPRSKARYTQSGPGRMLETQEFYDNGVLSAEGSYVDTGRYAPTPVGTHRQFDTQGRVKSESVYDARGRITRERAWDPSGALLRDDEVFEDGSRKAFSPASAR
ncbi:MAG: hypothetical protein V4505_01815 [Pseudomonadota bacterium]